MTVSATASKSSTPTVQDMRICSAAVLGSTSRVLLSSFSMAFAFAESSPLKTQGTSSIAATVPASQKNGQDESE